MIENFPFLKDFKDAIFNAFYWLTGPIPQCAHTILGFFFLPMGIGLSPQATSL